MPTAAPCTRACVPARVVRPALRARPHSRSKRQAPSSGGNRSGPEEEEGWAHPHCTGPALRWWVRAKVIDHVFAALRRRSRQTLACHPCAPRGNTGGAAGLGLATCTRRAGGVAASNTSISPKAGIPFRSTAEVGLSKSKRRWAGAFRSASSVRGLGPSDRTRGVWAASWNIPPGTPRRGIRPHAGLHPSSLACGSASSTLGLRRSTKSGAGHTSTGPSPARCDPCGKGDRLHSRAPGGALAPQRRGVPNLRANVGAKVIDPNIHQLQPMLWPQLRHL